MKFHLLKTLRSHFFACTFATAAVVCSLPSFAQDKSASTVELPATDDGLPGAGPIRRYDWFKNLWKQRRGAWVNAVEADQNAVVFFGDSITQGWTDKFHGYFPDLKKANRGISGDTTRGMLIRLEQDVLSLKPTCVVMLMGTNDLEEGAEPETIAGNIQLIIDKLEQHNAKMPVIVCEVFPSSDQKKRPAAKIKKLNELVRELATKEPQVTVLDTWTLFANEQGDAKSEEFPDLLHPNDKGYAKWAGALTPVLATLNLLETSPAEFKPDAGFESLFNGKDLTGWGYRPTSDDLKKTRDGWKNHPEWPIIEKAVSFDGQQVCPDGRYAAINGKLVVKTPIEGRKIQQIYTTKDFEGDFTLKLEFRATPNADSGIYLRGPQLQCRDYLLAGPYKELSKYKPLDWNQIEIVVKGDTAVCSCNGEVFEKAFKVPAVGPIGFEGDRGQVEYRNIQIKSGSSGDYGMLKPTADVKSWVFEQAEEGKGEIKVEGGAIGFRTTKAGSENWHVQAYQAPLALENNARYEITFEARSSDNIAVAISGLINEEDWHGIGLFEELYLTKEFQPFTVSFWASDVSKDNNRVGFVFGNSTGSFEVRNMKMVKAD